MTRSPKFGCEPDHDENEHGLDRVADGLGRAATSKQLKLPQMDMRVEGLMESTNPAAGILPGDFALFDFTEIETAVRELVFATDSWVSDVAKDGCRKSSPTVKDEAMTVLDDEWETLQVEVPMELETTLKNWILQHKPTTMVDGMFSALTYLMDWGCSADRLLAHALFDDMERAYGKRAGSYCAHLVSWGVRNPT